MNGLVLQFFTFPPLAAAISRFEKAARLLMTMGSDVKRVGVAWINQDVINEQTRNIEVVKQPPGARAVIGRVDLPIQGAEIKTGWIFGINHQGANVASRRSACTPILRIKTMYGCWTVCARG